ncbi:MAG TPA: translation elongation factor Ts [Bacteroidota bacterium]
MAITTEMIKKLRDNTGAGMMDCKKALEQTGGDMTAAVEYLRKKGAAVAAKRADRAAKEGMIVTRVSADGKTGVVVEVNCETDFVGRSPDFAAFADAVAAATEQQKPASVEELLSLAASDGKTLAAMQNDLLAKVGEKIEVRRFHIVRAKEGLVSSYTHMGSKIGVLVEVTGMTQAQAVAGLGRDMAMQIAAMNPMVVHRADVDKETVDRELDIYRTQAKNEGKPDKILDKIAAGRLEKFYQEVVLHEQLFIKDSAKTIKDVLQEAGAGVIQFVRYHLGEEAA